MTKEEGIIVFDGTVEETLRASTFAVKVEEQPELIVLCKLSGKMRKNRIRVLLGDKVKIEVSPYDLTKGRIVYRFA